MPPANASANAYLAQRVFSAGPEEQAALLMEAGQRHLGKAIQALHRQDGRDATRSFLRVSEVLAEATRRVDLKGGGEVARNLVRLYGWWGRELMAASVTRDPHRLEAVAQGMSGLREAWEQRHRQRLARHGIDGPGQERVV